MALEHRMTPKALTWEKFYAWWTEQCLAAWARDRSSPMKLVLPDLLFPHVVEIRNPVTHAMVHIERISMIGNVTWQNGTTRDDG